MGNLLMVEEGVTKVTLNVRDKLLKEMKHLAIEDETTFTELVNQAVGEYLQRRKKGGGRK